MSAEVKARVRQLCDALNARAAEAGRPECWFEAKAGPNYVKVLLNGAVGPAGVVPTQTFCFVVKVDSPFGWSNYRAGDVMAPKTWSAPWKMDAGALANVFEPDGGVSYWVVRYGQDLGLW